MHIAVTAAACPRRCTPPTNHRPPTTAHPLLECPPPAVGASWSSGPPWLTCECFACGTTASQAACPQVSRSNCFCTCMLKGGGQWVWFGHLEGCIASRSPSYMTKTGTLCIAPNDQPLVPRCLPCRPGPAAGHGAAAGGAQQAERGAASAVGGAPAAAPRPTS